MNRTNYRDARSYYIGTDNIVGGRALGTATKALLEAKGLVKTYWQSAPGAGGFLKMKRRRSQTKLKARIKRKIDTAKAAKKPAAPAKKK